MALNQVYNVFTHERDRHEIFPSTLLFMLFSHFCFSFARIIAARILQVNPQAIKARIVKARLCQGRCKATKQGLILRTTQLRSKYDRYYERALKEQAKLVLLCSSLISRSSSKHFSQNLNVKSICISSNRRHEST